MSLLEVLAAATLMATLMASSMVVLRGSYTAWLTHEADLERLESAYALLRHVTRDIRQAQAVASISDATSPSGSLELLMADGSSFHWEHQPLTNEVLFGMTTPTSLLADNIDEFTLIGYDADEVATAVIGDIRSVRCEVTVTLPNSASTTRTVSCTAWLRSW